MELRFFFGSRRSEEPSVTSVESYWKTPCLSQAGRSMKYMELQTLTQRTVPRIRQKSNVFLKKLIESINVRGEHIIWNFSSCKKKKTKILVCWHFFLNYKNKVDALLQNAEDFINFMRAWIKTTECERVEVLTRGQANSQEWFDLRFARVTASKSYEVSRCKTATGALTEAILDASTCKGTEAT